MIDVYHEELQPASDSVERPACTFPLKIRKHNTPYKDKKTRQVVLEWLAGVDEVRWCKALFVASQ